MNVIYMNHYSGSFLQPREWRPYYLSKSLVDLGVKVSVVCASFHHLHKEVYIQNNMVESKSIDGVDYFWLKVPFYKGNGFARIKNMFVFGFRAFRLDPVKDLKIGVPDVVVISSAHPFHFIAGLRWAKKYKAKLVFEIRDAWPLSLNLMLGLNKLHPFSLLLSMFQYLALKLSDKVIGLAGGLESYCLEKGMAQGKFVHVCNGIEDTQNFDTAPIIEDRLQEIRANYKRIVMYTGSLGIPNAMKYCISAMNGVTDPEIALVLIGGGAEEADLKNMVINENIFFLGSVPKDTIQSVLSYSDVCIISWLKLEVYKYGISPNKLFDYMYASKPIIQAIDSPHNIIGSSDCGLVIEPENIDAMRNAILSMCSLSDQELRLRGAAGRSLVLSEYTYSQLAKKVLHEAFI